MKKKIKPIQDIKFNIWILAGLILVALLISGFVGISQYKKSTNHLIELTDSRGKQFETLFDELKKARFRAMGIGADMLLVSKRLNNRFFERDRKGLAEIIDPVAEYIEKKHSIEQINFYIPPGLLFYRALNPELGLIDLTQIRPSLVQAVQNQQRLMAVENGIGGLLGIRALVPLFNEDKYIGTIEMVSNFNIPLGAAAKATNLKWALSMSQSVATRVQKPQDEKNDVLKEDEVYYDFSDPIAHDLILNADFDPRSKGYAILKSGDRKIYLRTVKVLDFTGTPTVTVALIDDLTDSFQDALLDALIHAGIAFIVLILAFNFVYFKFEIFKSALFGSIGIERNQMKSQVEMGQLALEKVKDLENTKRRFFGNLMMAIHQPLISISGQIANAKAILIQSQSSTNDLRVLDAALSQTNGLSKLVGDFQRIELFREELVNAKVVKTSITEVLSALAKDIAFYHRFPQFKVHVHSAAHVPDAQVDASLLSLAIMNLIEYAASLTVQGDVQISSEIDDEHWLNIRIQGSAFEYSEIPNLALLDEAKQFMIRLNQGAGKIDARDASLVGIILTRNIVEYFGGSLSIYEEKPFGFLIQLPTVA